MYETLVVVSVICYLIVKLRFLKKLLLASTLI